MRIVLLGSPASGKGTQGRRIAASLGLGYLSTGVLLRENIIGRTELGLAAEPILARGGYLPDDLMCPILADWLAANDPSSGWVLDGFPRSLRQAEFLDEWLAEYGSALDAAVVLEAPFNVLLRRIRDRVECSDCRWSGQRSELSKVGNCPKCGGSAAPRADDCEANFRNRYAEFLSLTIPVIDFYRKGGRLTSVPATGSKNETAATILGLLA
ncbi:MAG: nucleoside monophosphate kinase [Akkermansiaceae bacterium]|nr:nucleoside monophosphate kinase [Akkermansiaceae bacterium]